MKLSRLSSVIESGDLVVSGGNAVLFRPTIEMDLSAFDRNSISVQQTFYPEAKQFEAVGFKVNAKVDGTVAVVFATRSKVEFRGLIARANKVVGDGIVVVDGQKTDGIESIYKEVRKRVPLLGALSKSHGRIFWFQGSEAFADWHIPEPQRQSHGYVTTPGVFSADAIDKGSEFLVANLPSLKGRVADLGAGWGYLANCALEHPKVTEIHLVEAEKLALDCARMNVVDERAVFHWSDATDFTHSAPFQNIICNPPFHTSRAAEPSLGRAFIASAARLLAQSGTLYLVANRHLPYEATLKEAFREVSEIAGNNSFKVFVASRPARKRL